MGLQSVVSGTLGAVLGAKSQRDAARQNAQQVADQNALQRELYYNARGAGGNAILPMYFGPTEQRLSNDAVNNYDASQAFFGTPAERLAQGAAIRDRYQGLMDSGTDVLTNLYGGGLQNRLTNEYAPVAAATTALAKTKSGGILQGLRERIAALNAGNAAKGFVGSGSTAQNSLLRATIGGRQDAAAALAGGDLQNQLGYQNIRDRILQLQFGNLDQASNRARQDAALQQLPAEYAASLYQQQTAPFNFFKVGVGNPPQVQPFPTVQPNFSTGQAVAGAFQGLGSAALSSYLRSLGTQNAAGSLAGYGGAEATGGYGLPGGLVDYATGE